MDDPEPSVYDANFGKRILQDQIVQASTLEEVKASRVRKRTFSASVISERTIQIKDDDDNNSVRNRGPEKATEATSSTVSTSPLTTLGQLGLGSSRAVIKYVSTVPPAPFGSRTSTSNANKSINPTINPEDSNPRKVTIRTVLRRPPSKANSVPSSTTESNSNSTLTTQRRTRVRLQDSLLARVQGKLRARSTTPPTTTSTTTTTTEPTTTTTTTNAPIEVQDETTLLFNEEIVPETTKIFVMDDEPSAQTTVETTVIEDETQVPLINVEEEVVTETSVAMSIGESEAHKIVMTTIKAEDTTNNEQEELSTVKTNSEGILGSSLERPDGLQKELLAAIRRKISRNRESGSKSKQNISDIDVSPSSNSVGSTQQPPFFRPISFPTQERNRDSSRVKLFLRVTDEKAGSNIKIPNFSRIQGKLARLNAAITEGLRNDQLRREANNQTSSTSRPRIGAYTSTASSLPTTVKTTTTTSPTTTTTTTTPTTTTTTTTLSTTAQTESTSLLDEIVPVIAEKTHTYLDILRQRYRESSGPVTTTELPVLATSLEDDISKTTKKTQVEHPTSHFRPSSSSSEPESPSTTTTKSSSTTQKADVKIVKPRYGDFVPPILPSKKDIEEKERIVRNNNNDESDDSVIHDITGTTVYVVGVICIIPAAGLVAWIVRYVVKKRVIPNSENGSETGLNCPISDEDMMQVSKQNSNGALASSAEPAGKRKSMCLDEESIDETLYAAQESLKEELATSVWQISRQNMRLLTVLGEGNFGKVNETKIVSHLIR